MSMQTYSVVMPIIGILSLVSVFVGLVYLVMAVIGWRGPYGNRRLLRSLIFVSAYPITVILIQLLIHRVVLPTMARESQVAREQRADAAAYVKRGDKSPSFQLRMADGKDFDTDALRGKVVLINFFATWCGPCIKELPYIEELFRTHRDNDDFALLVIGREETDAKVIAFKTAQQLSFPIAADPDRSVYGLFAKELIPRTYLIGRDGTICFASTGYSEEDIVALKSAVQSQLSLK